MIKVKDLANGYTIEYDNDSFMHNFSLKKDGVEVKSDKTQEALEQYLERISKSDNKFKTPIKAFNFAHERSIDTGVITSANLIDESFWFISDDKAKWRSRRKENLSDKYYELTEENLFKINQIKERITTIKNLEKEITDIANSFELQITRDYISAKREGE